MTNMDQKSKNDPALAARNLVSIQRIDPCAVAILDKATHAALYKFRHESRTWEKTDVDGAMFIYQRADKPFYSLMIANRQSLTDMIEPINPLIKIKHEGQYLFFCKPDGIISGLWFYKEDDCSRIFRLLERLIEEVKSGRTAMSTDKPTSPISIPPSNESNQLLDLLKAAQQPSTSRERTRRDGNSASLSQAASYQEQDKSPSPEPAADMPVLLQKLMVQEQPKTITKAPATMVCADDLEKDFLRSANRRTQFQEFINSSSAISLAALSTRSVHGSEGEVDVNDVDSLLSNRIPVEEATFAISSGNTTPPLSKEQFLSALLHLMETDDQFLVQIHQAYVDAINKRIVVNKN